MKAKRKTTLKTLEDCNETLRQIGLIDVAIERHQGQCDRKVLETKRKAEELVKPLNAQKKALEGELELFYQAHKDELEAGGRKSVELAVGRMGRRKSTKLATLAGRTWQWALEMVKQHRPEFLRLKEAIDKEQLLSSSLDKDELARIGVRRKPVQTFWYEVDRVKIEALRGFYGRR